LVEVGHAVDLLLFRPIFDIPDEIPAGVRLVVKSEAQPRKQAGGKSSAGVPKLLEDRSPSTIFVHGKLRLRDWMRYLKALRFNPLTLPNRRMFEEARFVASYVEKEGAHCIVSNLQSGKVASLIAKVSHPSFPPVISCVHNDLQRRRKRDRLRYRLLLNVSDRIIAVSRGTRLSTGRFAAVAPERVTTIYNPVVTSELRKMKDEEPVHPWLSDAAPKDPPVILAAGRLNKVKDFPTLIKAVHHLAATRQTRLIILGEGKQRTKLEKLIEMLKIEDRVSLPGYVRNPYAFMSRASLFVLSSKFEGLGNVLIEALACGCPCVSTDCPSGPAEILDGGRVGPLVPIGDVQALADAIEHVLAQPPDRRVLQEQADSFSFENALTAYERIIMSTATPRLVGTALHADME